MEKSKIDLSLLRKALQSLKEALAPKNDLERDGAIQRFKCNFELSWKTLARVLEADKPLGDNSVRGILREGGRQNLIDDVEVWFRFQDARNRVSYIYEKKVAEEVFGRAREFPLFCEKLIQNLESRIK